MITEKLYGFLDREYVYFNENLFDNQLGECLITLNRKRGAYGYHHWQSFKSRKADGTFTSEIALNPDGFEERTAEEILSTLVHEMVHNLMHIMDIAPRKGYHDKQFASMMYDVGLQASSTGLPDGKPTGQKMSHYIITGGKFETVCKAFLIREKESGIDWDTVKIEVEKKERKKTREKFVCPNCMTNVWGKKDSNIRCGDCGEKFEIEEEDKEKD